MSAAASSSADAGTAKHRRQFPVPSQLSESDLLREFHSMLYAQVPTRRAFVCTGHIPVVPTLRMGEADSPLIAERRHEQELGTADDRLYQILSADNIECMRQHASPSQFGRGAETLYDPTVRSGRDLLPTDIWIEHMTSESAPDNYMDWFRLVSCSRLSPLLEQIRQQLAPRTPTIRARPYKLNLYTVGDHFTTHTDAPIAADHFGTLLIFLPAQHTGGELRISHEGLSETFSFGSVSACEADVSRTVVGCDWVAFYTDCRHEVRPVIDGHRVSMAYTLHIGEQEPDKWDQVCHCEPCKKRAKDVRVKRTYGKCGSIVSPMSHRFDVTMKDEEIPVGRKGYSHSHSNPAAASASAASAASSSAKSSRSVDVSAIPSPSHDADSLLLPTAWCQLRRALQSPDFATYRLPADVVDIVLSYLADASPLHQLFALPHRTFQRVAVLLAHGYPYAAIGSNASTAVKEISSADAGAASASSASSSAAVSATIPSAVPPLSRTESTGSDGLPDISTLNSPPARFFLKGRDRDLFDAIQTSCTGSNLCVRVVPVHVHVFTELYQPVWDVTDKAGEMQILEAIQPNSHQRQRNYSVNLHCTIEEILAFTLHGGTVDRVAKELKHPNTLFVNQQEWLHALVCQRAVQSMHEADFDPTGTSIDQLSHAKRAESYGAWAGDSTGNAGYNEQIQLQYISATILIEERTKEQ
jgi:hypothetical protein